jgi:hypothetical protein
LKKLTQSVIPSANDWAVLTATVLLFLGLGSSVMGQVISGTVTNGTTSERAAGDKVMLINLGDRMVAAAETRADSAGEFSFASENEPHGWHLIQAMHQGVSYHQLVPPGTSNVEVKVYDVAPSVPGIQVATEVMEFQQENSVMQGVRLFAVNNTSSPPKTQMNDHNFEFYLPQGARIERVRARAPNGQPVVAEAVAQFERNRYGILFPLRPGQTEFEVAFTMQYSGELRIEPKLTVPVEHMIVILPKSMRFSAERSSMFQVMKDPRRSDSTMEVVNQARPGQTLGFTLKGKGTISGWSQHVVAGVAQQPTIHGRDPAPVVPTNTRVPQTQYRWYVLVGSLLILGASGWYVTKRHSPKSTQPVPTLSGSTTPQAARPLPSVAVESLAPAMGHGTVGEPPISLEALKEQMFQLEMERCHEALTQSDYEKAKAALDETLRGSLKPQG